MEPRAQRQSLRQYLNSAREALEQGDRGAAHAAVDAALALDPHYLAAQALKEQIDRWPAAARVTRLHERMASDAFSHRVRGGDPADGGEAAGSPQETDSLPAVSPEGWMRFEHRARTRRLERRVQAARTAIGRRRFAEARAVIEEIREIDDGHPDLISLWIELDAAVHMDRSSTSLWRRAGVAAVVIGGVWLGAHYAADRVINRMHNAVASSPLREAPLAPPVVVGDDLRPPEQPVAQEPTPTPTPVAAPALPPPSAPPASTRPADERAPRNTPERPPAPALPAPAVSSALKAPIARAPEVQVPSVPREPVTVGTATRRTAGGAPDVVPAPVPPQPPLVPAVSPVALPSTPAIERPAVQTADNFATSAPPAEPASRALVSAAIVTPRADEELVRLTLQQYRAAYERLDAHSAQAVWPTVDEAALSRAFSGLQSQRLMFDDCQVQVRGAVGHATCRGTAVYVPRVGSRDPRREPRVWTFDLRKIGENWQIDTARAER